METIKDCSESTQKQVAKKIGFSYFTIKSNREDWNMDSS